jgi:hypothetical protein
MKEPFTGTVPSAEAEAWGKRTGDALPYRGYLIYYQRKPVSYMLAKDWDWQHLEYDGPEDRRCGAGRTLKEACLEVDENRADENPCPTCDGMGRLEPRGMMCPDCYGSGEAPQ